MTRTILAVCQERQHSDQEQIFTSSNGNGDGGQVPPLVTAPGEQPQDGDQAERAAIRARLNHLMQSYNFAVIRSADDQAAPTGEEAQGWN